MEYLQHQLDGPDMVLPLVQELSVDPSNVREKIPGERPIPTTELVPLDYDRIAYNAIHGKELRGHNDALTVEQARQINDNFDIQLCFGSHGIFDRQSENEILDSEYEAAARVQLVRTIKISFDVATVL